MSESVFVFCVSIFKIKKTFVGNQTFAVNIVDLIFLAFLKVTLK